MMIDLPFRLQKQIKGVFYDVKKINKNKLWIHTCEENIKSLISYSE